MGVTLYELKPNAFDQALRKHPWKKVPSLSLHTKMMIFDRDRLAIGSANIDPRSDKLNTELFMVIRSGKLTTQQYQQLDRMLTLDNFYRLSWGKYPYGLKHGSLHEGPVWETREKGKETRYYHRPKVWIFKAFTTDMLSLLPIKGYL